MVTGTLADGSKATFASADIAKQYGGTVDKVTDKARVSRSTDLMNEVNARGAAPTEEQMKEQYPDLKPGGLAYNGKVTNLPEPMPNAPAVTTTQPSPTNVNATPFTQATPPAQGASAAQQAYQSAVASGLPAPQQAGEARVSMGQFAPPEQPQTPPEVENFFQTSPIVQPTMAEMVEFISPASTRKELEQSMNKIVASQKAAAKLNLELMNVQRVMEGTDQDIRDEVEKVGGFATESQVQALTVGRNKTLLKRAAMIQDQLNYIKDVIQSDMTMYGFQKDIAQQEFQQRSFLLQYKQQNDQFIYNATQNAINRNLALMGPDGLYNAAQGDPIKIERLERAMGLAPGGLKTAADQAIAAKAEEARQQKFQEDMQRRQLAISGGNLALAREKFQYDVMKDQMNGGLDEATLGKITATPEYKTVNALIPAVQTIQRYQALVKKEGTFATGKARGELDAAYGNAIAAWKTLAGLGALSGADFELAENAIPSTGGFWSGYGLLKRDGKIDGRLSGSLENAVTQAETLSKRITQLYPQSSQLINTQLKDIFNQAYPNKRYEVGPDGQLYEITN